MKKERINAKKLKRNVKGITLIALVVTIIALLILAGVALNLTIGQNGIFSRAQGASSTWKNAETNEQLSMGIMEDWINENATGIQVEQVTDENPGVLEGAGTNTDPYTINSIEDLVFLSYDVREGNTYDDKTLKLGLSLDFNSTKSYVEPYRSDYEKYGYDGELKTLLTTGEGFIPIGSIRDNSATFGGVFDGNGKELINLYINKNNTESGDYLIGLFGNNQGTIKNLGINNCKINVSSTSTESAGIMVSGLVGYNRTGTISSCYVTGNFNIKVTGTTSFIRTGAISGNSHGNIINCYANTNVLANGDGLVVLGGLVGAGNGTVNNSYYIGNLISEKSGSIHSGGIEASHGAGNITNCYNVGNIYMKQNNNLSFQNLGGIVGENTKTAEVINSYNYGKIEYSIENPIYIGAIVGTNNSDVLIQGGYLKNEKYVAIGNLNQGAEQTVEYNSINEMPSILSIIGEEFKDDTNNINNGYPILNWQ